MREDILKTKLAKLENLKKVGMDPYPEKTERSFANAETLERFNSIKSEIYLVGRVKSFRPMGNAAFAHIEDGTGKIQIFLSRKNLKIPLTPPLEKGDKGGFETDKYKLFVDNIEIGDFIEVKGKLFKTKSGEKTLEVSDWKILSKSLLPLPTEWYGLKDIEERHRKRYLDFIINPDVRKVFIMRTEIIQASRAFFEEKGYLEVETPILQPIYGGGLARPFRTNHNALGIPLYMRISDELYLKRLIIGGFEKVYEICKDFRNEGVDKFHNPEFTLLEPMTAYKDYTYTMDLIEEYYEYVVKKIKGTLEIKYENIKLNFKRPWARFSMKEIVKSITSYDYDKINTMEQARAEADKLKIDKKKIVEQLSLGDMLNLVFEEKVQEKLIQPTIIYDYPVETSPLAKKCSRDERFVSRFEQYILGQEHGNNYSELNDPLDLKKRFIEEAKRKKAGFEGAHQTDNDFLEAVEYGMPPVSGGGISIDRLVMILTNTQNIRDVILFPLLKPKKIDNDEK